MDDRSALQKKLKARLDQAQAEIDRLDAKQRESEADVQLEIGKQVEVLQERKERTQQKLSEISEATGDAWKEMQAGASKAWEDLGAAVESAKEKLQS